MTDTNGLESLLADFEADGTEVKTKEVPRPEKVPVPVAKNPKKATMPETPVGFDVLNVPDTQKWVPMLAIYEHLAAKTSTTDDQGERDVRKTTKNFSQWRAASIEKLKLKQNFHFRGKASGTEVSYDTYLTLIGKKSAPEQPPESFDKKDLTSHPVPGSNLTEDELMALSVEELTAVKWRLDWKKSARAKQMPPDDKDWKIWMLCAGRGFGKTRTGAEAIAWYAWRNAGCHVTLIAPTTNDVRGTQIEGQSGLVGIIPPKLIAGYNRSLLEITLVNGSKIKGYSAQEPERLRGLNSHACWIDELAAFPKETIRDAWDMMMLGLRAGTNPKLIITTTPKPIPLVREIVDKAVDPKEGVYITTGSSYENRLNLAETFFDQIAQYEGTQLGRQEIHAEILDPEESGIIKRSWFKLWPATKPLPRFEYVIQSYDTAFTEKTQNDPTGCTVWGVFDNNGDMCVLLCDAWIDHLKYPDLRVRAVEEYNTQYGEPGRKPDVVLIEEKGSGISLIQDLQRGGVPIRAYNPGKADKVQRLHAVSHLILNGRCFIPESTHNKGRPRDWVEPYLNQVCSFPLVDHDEYVDTTSQALALLRDQTWLTVDVDDYEEYYEPSKKRGNPYAA